MSYYTKFADVEPLLTSTTTTVLASTDAILVFNQASQKYYQATVGALGLLGGSMTGALASQATTLTTATNITNSGFTFVKSTGASTSNWLLSDPTAIGQTKTIFCNSTTTSTNWGVTTVTASIQCTAGTSANQINFASTATGAMVNFGQSVTLVSQTTTSWIVIAQQRNPTAVSSGQVGANGSGPIFQLV